MTEELSDYTQKGNTWWMTEKKCPKCECNVSTNGSVYTCIDCDWWNPISQS